MPGKARRVASRQSQLNQRRKKQNRGPRGIPAAVGARPSVNSGANGRPDAQAPEPSRAAQPVATAPRPERTSQRPSPVNRQAQDSSRAPRREPTAATSYVGYEIKRILALAGAVVAVIVGLSFVV